MAEPAIATYSTAKGYVQCAYLMMSNPARYQAPDDTTFILGFHMLAGFATELYLKAFLTHNAYNDARLRAPQVRHNLGELLRLAESEGLDNHGAKQLVDLLDEGHKRLEFRYMNPDSSYKIRDIKRVFDAFSSLDVVVDEVTGASASKGRKSSGRWEFPSRYAGWRVRNFVIQS